MRKNKYQLVHRQNPGTHKWTERRIYVRSVTSWLHAVLIEIDLPSDELYPHATTMTYHLEHFVFGTREKAEGKYV